ncbi:hypothetical protein HZB01_02310 [Candidatus Woesearchaeota archaeon]|nr:hypothetical protein [Candidatus Woesearchaeota archaeon]
MANEFTGFDYGETTSSSGWMKKAGVVAATLLTGAALYLGFGHNQISPQHELTPQSRFEQIAQESPSAPPLPSFTASPEPTPPSIPSPVHTQTPAPTDTCPPTPSQTPEPSDTPTPAPTQPPTPIYTPPLVSSPKVPAPTGSLGSGTAFAPQIVGFQSYKAVLGLPQRGNFDPAFSFTSSYTVLNPVEVQDGRLVFRHGATALGHQYGFDAVGVNITANKAIVGKAYSRLGDDITIPLTDDMKSALNTGGAGFQVMALKQMGRTNKYTIVASYANGRFGLPSTPVAQEVHLPAPSAGNTLEGLLADTALQQMVDQGYGSFAVEGTNGSSSVAYLKPVTGPDDERLQQYISMGNKVRSSLPAALREGAHRQKVLTTVIEKYLSGRSGEVLDGQQVRKYLDEFECDVAEVADLYMGARQKGLSHATALEHAAQESAIGGVACATDAYECLKIAQHMGLKVTIGRWDKTFFDEQDVGSFIAGLYAQKDVHGKKTYATKEILAQVADHFGHTMSESTMRNYLSSYATASLKKAA